MLSLLLQGAALLPLCSFPLILILTKSAQCKGIAGAPSSVHTLVVGPQLSLQQKTTTAKKRVSVQSPLRFPPRSSEDLSSSESSTSSSGDGKEVLVGKDAVNKIETSFIVPAKCHDPLPQGTCLNSRGGCHYGSPLAHGHFGL